MAVPTSIDDLSTTPSANPPDGNETPVAGNDHIQFAYSTIALLRDKLDGTSATGTVKGATFDGTHTFNAGGNLLPSTYTPTLANVSGTSSLAVAGPWMYVRVGSILFVCGRATLTTTTTGLVTFSATVPVSSAFVASYQAAGSGTFLGATYITAGVQAEASTSTVRIRFHSAAAESASITLIFGYIVV